MSTTVRSTTGTAPIGFTDRGDGTVRIDLADGSTQVYRRAELLAALVAPAPTNRTVVEDDLDLVIEDNGDILEMSGDGMAPWSFAPKDAHRLVVALLAHTARLWDDAEVMVRRSERALGQAIRTGQEQGEIAERGRVDKSSRREDLVSPSEYLPNGQVMHETYALTDDVTDEQFDEALTRAQDEQNVSRANVVRKVREVGTATEIDLLLKALGLGA